MDKSKTQNNNEKIDRLKEFLPKNYLVLIHNRINKAITIRQIRYVISGNQNDYHGVINAMCDIAAEEKAKREAIKKRIAKLTK